MNGAEELIYIPTETEKIKLDNKCSRVIDLLSDLTIEQKAFALMTLINSFEDMSGVKLIAIKEE